MRHRRIKIETKLVFDVKIVRKSIMLIKIVFLLNKIFFLYFRLLVGRLVGDGRIPAVDPTRNRGRLSRRPHGRRRTSKLGRGRKPNLRRSQKRSRLPRPRDLGHQVPQKQIRRKRRWRRRIDLNLKRGRRVRPVQPPTLSFRLSRRNNLSR